MAWLDRDLRHVRAWNRYIMDDITVAVAPVWLKAMGIERACSIAAMHKATLVEAPARPACGIEVFWPDGGYTVTMIGNRTLPS